MSVTAGLGHWGRDPAREFPAYWQEELDHQDPPVHLQSRSRPDRDRQRSQLDAAQEAAGGAPCVQAGKPAAERKPGAARLRRGGRIPSKLEALGDLIAVLVFLMGVTSVQFFREKTVFIWFDYSQNFVYSREELHKISSFVCSSGHSSTAELVCFGNHEVFIDAMKKSPRSLRPRLVKTSFVHDVPS